MPNTTSSWIQTFFWKLKSSWITQKGICNGLIAPSHFTRLAFWIQNSTLNLLPWKRSFTSQSKMSSLVKIGSCFGTKILDAKYEKTDVADVMKGLTNLNAHQKADLLWLLQENKKMFNETLGVYPHKKVHIDIEPNAMPVHSRPYPVPWINLKIFKIELDHLVRIGVLSP